jgi:hypothetical protein
MLRRLAAAAAAGLVVVAVSATPAYAGTYGCISNSVCLWSDLNWNGQKQTVNAGNLYTDLNPQLHDQASGWGSSSNGQAMCVINWIGASYEVLGRMNPGNRTPWVGNALNDKADAVVQWPQWTGNCLDT